MTRPLHTLKNLTTHPLMFALYVPATLFAVMQSMLTPILPIYADHFSNLYWLIGVVLAGDGIGALLGDIPAGMLTRRFGSKRIMMAGLLVGAGATLALWWAASIPEVFAYRLVAGVARAHYHTARHTYVARKVDLSKRGRALSILGGTFRFGNMIGPTLGGLIAGYMGLRAPFPVYVVISVSTVMIIGFALRDESPDAVAAGSHGLHDVWDVLRSHGKILLVAGSGMILGQAVRAGRMVLIPLYGARVLNLEVEQIGLIVSAVGATNVAVFYFSGVIMDRWGRKWAIVPSFALQALAAGMIPLSGNFYGLLVIAALGGLANGFSSGTMMTLGADLAPTNARGEFLGLWNLLGDLGAASIPLIVGVVADALTLAASAGVIAGAGLGAALIFGRYVPETLDRRLQTHPAAAD